MIDSLISELRCAVPIAFESLSLEGRRIGLVIVDEVVGFASVGGGNLAPRGENAQVSRMVWETDAFARSFIAAERPIFVFLDTHEQGKPEPPYPPHCIEGTGEEKLVPELAWLAAEPLATLVRKDCINGFIGAMTLKGNRLVDWVREHRLDSVLTVGICTDICVMDFVLTLLSARNHGLTFRLKDICVYEPACVTYDLPEEAVRAAGLPATATHPQGLTNHMGLYFMAARGARLIDSIA
ncbi:MAG: isochorismatase family protein [Alphaproteobacteria bacterium]|nr:isochorismatase family protein [Alphaproteobacteria bacterium]